MPKGQMRGWGVVNNNNNSSKVFAIGCTLTIIMQMPGHRCQAQ